MVEIWKYVGMTIPALGPGHAGLLVLTGTGLAEPHAGWSAAGAPN